MTKNQLSDATCDEVLKLLVAQTTTGTLKWEKVGDKDGYHTTSDERYGFQLMNDDTVWFVEREMADEPNIVKSSHASKMLTNEHGINLRCAIESLPPPLPEKEQRVLNKARTILLDGVV